MPGILFAAMHTPNANAAGTVPGFMGRFGLGLDVYITERIGISLESDYVLPTGRANNFNNFTVSWSLFYRFDNEDDE